MRKWLYSLLLMFPVILIAQDLPMNVMTFNIRYPNPDDGFNYWPNRKDLVASMIRYHEADLIGVQEAFRGQLDELMEMLPGFKWTGVCRTDGQLAPDPDNEFSAILYREERFELLEEGTFWLSETPDQVGSKSWDAALPRIVSWAKFKDRSAGKEFFHFNTHFDHRGEKAREESARLILQRMSNLAEDLPSVLTGDFNCLPTSKPYRILTDTDEAHHLTDALFISRIPHHGPLGTWTDSFLFPGVPGRRIDYIFVNEKMVVHKHAILSDSWSGRLPSDHLPVIARMEVK